MIEYFFYLFQYFCYVWKFFVSPTCFLKNCWGISKNPQIMWQKYWKINFQKSLLWPTSWFDSGYQEPKFQVYHDPFLVADELNSILVHESNDEKIIYTSQHMYRNIDVNNLKKIWEKSIYSPNFFFHFSETFRTIKNQWCLFWNDLCVFIIYFWLQLVVCIVNFL